MRAAERGSRVSTSVSTHHSLTWTQIQTYRCDRDCGKSKRVTNDVPEADALAAILGPRVFHFPERW